MKTICVMQPYMFPYLGYFQLAEAVDEFWLFDCVQYIRRGWMNRNFVCVDGQPKRFTFSIEKGHQSDLISEKKFSDQLVGEIENLTALVNQAYRKTPFYCNLFDVLEKHRCCAVQRAPVLFSSYSYESLTILFSHLGVNTPLYRTSELNIDPSLRAQERIIEVCNQVGARRYVNPAGGRALYDASAFARYGVSLGYITPEPNSYLPNKLSEELTGSYSVLDFIARVEPMDYPAFLRAGLLEWEC